VELCGDDMLCRPCEVNNAAELAKLRAEQQRDASPSGDNAVSNEKAEAGHTDIAYKEVLITSAEVEVIVTKAVSLAVTYAPWFFIDVGAL